MDDKTATVKLWEQIVGAIAWSEDDQIGTFEFDPKFLTTQLDVAPIMMPVNSKRRVYSFIENKGSNSTFRGLPGLLADMLPDKYGNALINAWIATQGRVNLTPAESLCFIGTRGMGALEIVPSLREESQKNQ